MSRELRLEKTDIELHLPAYHFRLIAKYWFLVLPASLSVLLCLLPVEIVRAFFNVITQEC